MMNEMSFQVNSNGRTSDRASYRGALAHLKTCSLVRGYSRVTPLQILQAVKILQLKEVLGLMFNSF